MFTVAWLLFVVCYLLSAISPVPLEWMDEIPYQVFPGCLGLLVRSVCRVCRVTCACEVLHARGGLYRVCSPKLTRMPMQVVLVMLVQQSTCKYWLIRRYAADSRYIGCRA